MRCQPGGVLSPASGTVTIAVTPSLRKTDVTSDLFGNSFQNANGSPVL